MNRPFLLLCCSFLAVSFLNAQNGTNKPFKVNGTLTNPGNAEWVYMNYVVDGARKTDSSQLKNGTYQFNGILAEPTLSRFMVSYKAGEDGKRPPTNGKRDMISVFLEPGAVINITSTDSFSNIKVKGSESHTAFMALEKELKSDNDKMQALSQQYSMLYRAKDTAGMKALEPKFDEIGDAMKKTYEQYILANPKSPVALYALGQFAGYDIDADKVEPVFAKLPAAARNSPTGKQMAEKIETAKKTGVGRIAMDFSQNDTSGVPVKLSSFRGKYVLIDFWASWCGPCRVENPNVVEAFNKYKDKGFTVLGVSLDRQNDKEKWLKAIYDDQLAWTHVSDLQFWKNAVAVQYGIQAIPQNFLVDPNGKIIGKNLRGEALQKKLESLFQ